MRKLIAQKINYREIWSWLKWDLQDFLYIVLSLLLALLFGAIFILILGSNPIEVYGILFSKAFTSIGQVLRRSTVYIFTGLAVAIPVQTGVINMGGEGQVAAGALAAAVIGGSISLPGIIHPIACMLAAAAVGALLASVAAVMKVRFGSSEVVAGIMINYIVIYALQYLSMYTFRGSVTAPQTAPILDSAKIARAFGTEQWSYGLFIALAVCILLAFVMKRTRLGLELKSSGLNPQAARYQGVNVKYMSILAMLIGGAMAGLGGSLEVLGCRYVYMDNYFTNYGFDGIAVSYMARNSPLGIIVTAFLVSALKVGALAVDRQTNINIHFATALQGVIIALLVTPLIARRIVTGIRALLIPDRKAKVS